MQGRAVALTGRCLHALKAQGAGLATVSVGGGAQPSRAAAAAPPRKKLDARRVLCVASCKGGVGKSSVAVNLAAALAAGGQRVGVLDMDIFGPSLPSLVPRLADQKVRGTAEGLIVPLQWHCNLPHPLQLMSYGFLRPGEFAAIRGPIVSGIAQQLLTGVAWEGLDTLVIDMPPGTGDVHLTVSQSLPVDGAVMVTTPQQLAVVDVEKGIKMFDKVGIPTIAVVENMSYLDCGGCGTRHSIFGEGGGKRLAEQFGIANFHQLPLDPMFNSASAEATDGPVVAGGQHADRPIVRVVHQLSESVEAELSTIFAQRGDRPKVVAIDNGKALSVTGGGLPPVSIPARTARLACRCAHCVDEWTNEPRLDPSKVPLDVAALQVGTAGRYAVSVQWSDLHSSLTPISQLRQLAHS